MKWKPGTLGVIINQFKRKCTIEMGKLAENSIWQPRFYDHVVRNEQSLFRIREYIKNNPKNWKIDRNYCGN
jgi:REP element-mobilizing transposase RayT